MRLARLRGIALGLAMAAAGCSDGSGSPAIGSPAPITSPTPTPTGSVLRYPELVYTGPGVAAPTGKQEVFTAQSDGTGSAQLTFDGTVKFLPHFSPDGRMISYTKFTRGGYGSPDMQTEVAVFDRETATERVLTSGGVSVNSPWSPDGKTIAFSTLAGDGLWLMNPDASGKRLIGRPSGQPDDQRWADLAWSRDNWIYFTVGTNVNGCFKVRIDRIRPDGSQRTQITDGGPNCTPAGMEQSGDADPGISPDGSTIYSSRGFPRNLPGRADLTVRHLYRIDATPWYPGKPETDISAAQRNDCIAGVPKVSPDNALIVFFDFCTQAQFGVTVTDRNGSAYRYLFSGFGADWDPVAI